MANIYSESCSKGYSESINYDGHSITCGEAIMTNNNENYYKSKSFGLPSVSNCCTSEDKSFHSSENNDIIENDDYIIIKKKPNEKKEEIKDMSMCFAIRTKNRIILISDSRSTRGNGSYIDNFKKIVYLPKSKIAFICAETNIINNQNITDFISQFDDELVSKDISEAMDFIAEEIQKKLADNNMVNICGNKFDDKGISYYCDIDTKNIRKFENILFWRNSFDENVFEKLFVKENSVEIPDISALNEKQVADLFTQVIKMQEVYNTYKGLPNIVGGDIQVLVLDKDGCKESIIKN